LPNIQPKLWDLDSHAESKYKNNIKLNY
jgi:hypothetical protein